MNVVVFLLEEESMRALLSVLLPPLYPDLTFQFLVFEGKSGLEKNIPRKLRGKWPPGYRFVVLRDNDGGNCVGLKRRLMQSCKDAGRPDTLVRIVCQELESWFLGEPEALAEAFGDKSLRNLGSKARFRVPDTVPKPSDDLRKLLPTFAKVSGAKKMACYLTRERNKSHSFQVLMSGLDKLCEDLDSVSTP